MKDSTPKPPPAPPVQSRRTLASFSGTGKPLPLLVGVVLILAVTTLGAVALWGASFVKLRAARDDVARAASEYDEAVAAREASEQSQLEMAEHVTELKRVEKQLSGEITLLQKQLHDTDKIRGVEAQKEQQELQTSINTLSSEVKTKEREILAKVTELAQAKAEIARLTGELRQQKERAKELDEQIAKAAKQGENRNSQRVTPVNLNVAEYEKSEVMIIFPQDGKLAEAKQLCENVLGLNVRNTNERVPYIVCTWETTRTALPALLKDLDGVDSVIKDIRPTLGELKPDTLHLVPAAIRLSDDYVERRWGLDRILASAAWERFGIAEEGQEDELIVAIIDSGFDLEHRELAGLFIKEQHFFYSDPRFFITGSDADVGVPSGHAAFLSSDVLAHGTHVAGIIASVALVRSRDGQRRSQRIKIMPLQVELSETGGWPDALVADAISYAVEQGADIINISASEKISRASTFPATETVIAKGLSDEGPPREGLLIVCSAGNENLDVDDSGLPTNFVVPACLGHHDPRQIAHEQIEERHDSIIAVGSIDNQGKLSEFSNYGRTSIDLAAPGGNGLESTKNGIVVKQASPLLGIWSTIPEARSFVWKWGQEELRMASVREQYEFSLKDDPNIGPDRYFGLHGTLSGTSQAAPFVAGAAALIWAQRENRGKTAKEIKDQLLANVRPSDELREKLLTAGTLSLSYLKPEEEPATEIPVTPVVPEPIPTRPINPIARAYFGIGLDHFWNCRLEEAIGWFESAIDVDPNDPAYHYFAAFTYRYLDGRPLAEQHLSNAIRLEQDIRSSDYSQLLMRFQGTRRAQFERARRLVLDGLPFELASFWDHWPLLGQLGSGGTR